MNRFARHTAHATRSELNKERKRRGLPPYAEPTGPLAAYVKAIPEPLPWGPETAPPVKYIAEADHRMRSKPGALTLEQMAAMIGMDVSVVKKARERGTFPGCYKLIKRASPPRWEIPPSVERDAWMFRKQQSKEAA